LALLLPTVIEDLNAVVMSKAIQAVLFAVLALSGSAERIGSKELMSANPIRKVVTLLQDMQKKVESEGATEDELFEKFQCYCKNGKVTLAESIEAAETKIPQLESQIEEMGGAAAQLVEDLKNHKADREAAKEAQATATATREKEAAAFAKEHAESTANLEAATKATAAITKGLGGSFLQTGAAAVLRRLVLTQDMTNDARDDLTNFLAGGNQEYAPGSDEIVGILKQMMDTMQKDLADVIAQEDEAKKEYDGLMGAKEKEIASLTKAIEEKTKRVGEVGVELVNLKEDLDDTSESLAEDKKFLKDLDGNCETKAKEYEATVKTRQEELLAIADTIKMLNSDDALDLFKKTLPSSAASLLQIDLSEKQVRNQALRALSKGRGHKNFGIDLIALALRSKGGANFDKVLKMIDDMVILLGKEQVDDDDKKAYCAKEFDESDDKKKVLERSVSDLTKAIEEASGTVATTVEEIKALEEGIVKLDKEVAGATEQRKEEHEEFTSTLAGNNGALALIEMAKNRMNKFYNPKLAKFIQTEAPAEAFIQLRLRTRLMDAPALVQHRTKKQESSGVIAMMDGLLADLNKEILEMELTEKDAQGDYETMVNDAAEKRGADSKSIEEKEGARAALEAEVVKMGDHKASEEAELMATKQYISELHADCDWLIDNFETRKEARTNEIDAMKKAKAVLSGAGFVQTDDSLVQTARRSVLARRI